MSEGGLPSPFIAIHESRLIALQLQAAKIQVHTILDERIGTKDTFAEVHDIANNTLLALEAQKPQTKDALARSLAQLHIAALERAERDDPEEDRGLVSQANIACLAIADTLEIRHDMFAHLLVHRRQAVKSNAAAPEDEKGWALRTFIHDQVKRDIKPLMDKKEEEARKNLLIIIEYWEKQKNAGRKVALPETEKDKLEKGHDYRNANVSLTSVMHQLRTNLTDPEAITTYLDSLKETSMKDVDAREAKALALLKETKPEIEALKARLPKEESGAKEDEATAKIREELANKTKVAERAQYDIVRADKARVELIIVYEAINVAFGYGALPKHSKKTTGPSL